MARLLLRTEYRSACARSRSSRSPAGGAAVRGCGGAAVQVAGCSGARCREVQRCRAVRGCGDTEACRGGAVQQGGGAARHFPRRRRATTRRARAPARRPLAASPAGCATPRLHAACMAKGGGIGGFGGGELKHPEAAAISTSGPASPHGSRAARRALWRRRSRARGTTKGL